MLIGFEGFHLMIRQPGKDPRLKESETSTPIQHRSNNSTRTPTCKLAISFLSSFCPASLPTADAAAAVATAAAEAAVNAGVLADSRTHPDADVGVSPPICRVDEPTPEKDGIGLV